MPTFPLSAKGAGIQERASENREKHERHEIGNYFVPFVLFVVNDFTL
jgi:hypothetical protein